MTGTNPTSLLVPDQPWEAGTVEAPDLVTTGGHYYLFFSGNDWNSSNYTVGVATCTGPLGPCSDATPSPILSIGALTIAALVIIIFSGSVPAVATSG